MTKCHKKYKAFSIDVVSYLKLIYPVIDENHKTKLLWQQFFAFIAIS